MKADTRIHVKACADQSHAVTDTTMSATQLRDEAENMTPALEGTVNVRNANPVEDFIGGDGPSPSNLALVVFLADEEAPQILVCKDHDPRTLEGGRLRPTHGTLKASFGFGLPKDHAFRDSYEAITKGPANEALYGIFDDIGDRFTCVVPGFVYSEGGERWGPAVTIPVVVRPRSGTIDDVTSLVQALNERANAMFSARSADDIMVGRFRDFSLIPLHSLLGTGSDQPAVYDADKLKVITAPDGSRVRLWDEDAMRNNLLPCLARFISSRTTPTRSVTEQGRDSGTEV